jgi:hypothetical protein
MSGNQSHSSPEQNLQNEELVVDSNAPKNSNSASEKPSDQPQQLPSTSSSVEEFIPEGTQEEEDAFKLNKEKAKKG